MGVIIIIINGRDEGNVYNMQTSGANVDWGWHPALSHQRFSNAGQYGPGWAGSLRLSWGALKIQCPRTAPERSGMV